MKEKEKDNRKIIIIGGVAIGIFILLIGLSSSDKTNNDKDASYEENDKINNGNEIEEALKKINRPLRDDSNEKKLYKLFQSLRHLFDINTSIIIPVQMSGNVHNPFLKYSSVPSNDDDKKFFHEFFLGNLNKKVLNTSKASMIQFANFDNEKSIEYKDLKKENISDILKSVYNVFKEKLYFDIIHDNKRKQFNELIKNVPNIDKSLLQTISDSDDAGYKLNDKNYSDVKQQIRNITEKLNNNSEFKKLLGIPEHLKPNTSKLDDFYISNFEDYLKED